MTALEFSYDPPEQQAIEQVIDWAKADDTKTFVALVDVALLDHEKFYKFAKRNSWRIHNSLGQSSLSAFGDHAPQLVELPAAPLALRESMMKLLRFAGHAPATSWLRTTAGMKGLLPLFGYLAKVQVEDRKAPIHCRFADARVLPSLLGVLSPEQVCRVSSAIHDWSWFDRNGQAASWHPDTSIAATNAQDESPNLRLSISQFRTMQAEAEADGMFQMLVDKTPEIVPDIERGAFHRRLQEFLQTADELRIVEKQDRLQFVVLSLTCGKDFHAMLELRPTWEAVAKGASLCQLMQGWSDLLWQELDKRDGKTG